VYKSHLDIVGTVWKTVKAPRSLFGHVLLKVIPGYLLLVRGITNCAMRQRLWRVWRLLGE
jgi:hypothetical protein